MRDEHIYSTDHRQSPSTSQPAHLDSDPPERTAYEKNASEREESKRSDSAQAESALTAEDSANVGGFVLRELAQVLFPALLLALTIHLFLAQATIVYGRSMEPNLHERQRLIVDKFTYRFFHSPRRNDIIVIKLPDMDELLVKRIVGLPYEVVAIENGIVYINGEPLPEPFPHDTFLQNVPPRRLGPLEYFVLGDNRGNSNDSRVFGPIMRKDIKGRVWFRYWPLTELHAF